MCGPEQGTRLFRVLSSARAAVRYTSQMITRAKETIRNFKGQSTRLAWALLRAACGADCEAQDAGPASEGVV